MAAVASAATGQHGQTLRDNASATRHPLRDKHQSRATCPLL